MDKRKRRLLCMLEGSGQKSRWISGAPPLQYSAKKQGTLKNYRIYGNTVNGENVGDLITEGEHAGEYSVPVTVEGKNLLPRIATSQTINGVTLTANDDGSVTCNGTATVTTAIALLRNISISNSTILSGCPVNGGVNSYLLRFISLNPIVIDEDVGLGKTITNFRTGNIEIRVAKDYTCDNITFYPMIRKADIEDDTYEPYHAPVTTPIYLPEQIRKVRDEAEYISYANQKLHRIGADDIDVTLPALPTLTGTNVLSVGTAVQPSEIEVKGKIKAI